MAYQHPNPGLKETIWIDNNYISEMAHGFSQMALNMAATLENDPHEPKRNVVYTNALLAIELYFKSKIAVRVFDPAHAIINDNQTLSLGDEEQIESGIANIAIMHSRVVMPDGRKTHDIHVLFNALEDDFKKSILTNVMNETPLIKDMKALDDFILKVKGYFVTKRYAFEFFQEAVPPDADYMLILIPVIKGISKTFGYRE